MHRSSDAQVQMHRGRAAAIQAQAEEARMPSGEAEEEACAAGNGRQGEAMRSLNQRTLPFFILMTACLAAHCPDPRMKHPRDPSLKQRSEKAHGKAGKA
eukprot:scaffold326483_cov54-Tisochrysis_lutea.AAC.1